MNPGSIVEIFNSQCDEVGALEGDYVTRIELSRMELAL